jgi:MinD superfamily P-loop ATPase
MSVVINRSGLGDAGVENFCRDQGLTILAQIPFHRDIAQAYSRGCIVADSADWIKDIFIDLASKIRQGALADQETEYA